MGLPTDTLSTFAAVGNREDLSDIIYDISPAETPFLSAIPKVKASGTKHEWQTHSLTAASSSNFVLEGDDATTDAATTTTRLYNYRAISDKVLTKMVGDRQRDQPLKGRAKASGALLLARGRWTPHDLRRTMATMMRGELRISSDVVERCLNHKPQGIVGVYQTGELLDERKEAFEAWGAELERLQALDVSNVRALPGARAA